MLLKFQKKSKYIIHIKAHFDIKLNASENIDIWPGQIPKLRLDAATLQALVCAEFAFLVYLVL